MNQNMTDHLLRKSCY